MGLAADRERGMGDQAAQEVAHRRPHGPAHATGGGNVVAGSGDQGREAGPAAGPAAGHHGALAEVYTRHATASLPAEQRQVIELAYFGGYTHAEIADMARVPLGTVKGRMRLALEKMGSYLRGRGLVDV